KPLHKSVADLGQREVALLPIILEEGTLETVGHLVNGGRHERCGFRGQRIRRKITSTPPLDNDLALLSARAFAQGRLVAPAIAIAGFDQSFGRCSNNGFRRVMDEGQFFLTFGFGRDVRLGGFIGSFALRAGLGGGGSILRSIGRKIGAAAVDVWVAGVASVVVVVVVVVASVVDVVVVVASVVVVVVVVGVVVVVYPGAAEEEEEPVVREIAVATLAEARRSWSSHRPSRWSSRQLPPISFLEASLSRE
ncbi:Unknown protein, partial [Striga hermonthica]